jgi:hypothetical protein
MLLFIVALVVSYKNFETSIGQTWLEIAQESLIVAFMSSIGFIKKQNKEKGE